MNPVVEISVYPEFFSGRSCSTIRIARTSAWAIRMLLSGVAYLHALLAVEHDKLFPRDLEDRRVIVVQNTLKGVRDRPNNILDVEARKPRRPNVRPDSHRKRKVSI